VRFNRFARKPLNIPGRYPPASVRSATFAAEHGKNADSVITDKLKLLSEAYGNLSDPNSPPIEYAPPETRFAYVFSYVATNADYVYQILWRTQRELWAKLTERDKLVVTCEGHH
jgi:hypothetical protein